MPSGKGSRQVHTAQYWQVSGAEAVLVALPVQEFVLWPDKPVQELVD